MAKAPDESMQTYLAKQYDAEPYIKVTVNSKSYTTKNHILSIGGLETISKSGSLGGSSGSINITLDGNNNDVAYLYTRQNQKRVVEIYQCFTGLSSDHDLLIFKGQMSSPI